MSGLQLTPLLILELSAVMMTAVCIFLAGRNNIHTWWTGIVACILFGALFYQSQLYADATLQVFFVITGVIGWATWRLQTALRSSRTEAPPTNASKKTMAGFIAFGVVGAIAYGSLLHHFTDAYAPFVDSFVLTFSIVAQLLLMRRNIETWPMWLLVNIISVPLYFSRELYITAGLYVFCLANAVWSWVHWRKLQERG